MVAAGIEDGLLFLILLVPAALFGAILSLPWALLARRRHRSGAAAWERWLWRLTGLLTSVAIPAIAGFLVGAGIPDERAGEAAMLMAALGAAGGLVGAVATLVWLRRS